MSDSRESKYKSFKRDSTVQKNLSYGRNKNEGLVASRSEMENGFERILKDIKG